MEAMIVYAKAGAGHRRAAEAVFSAFKKRAEEEKVALVDCLDYTNACYKRVYPAVYLFLIRFFPFLWKIVYYSLENRIFYSLIAPLRHMNNYLVAQRFVRFLKRERPKVVISTQFFASDVVALLKGKGEINCALISVVTDFGAHTFWESENVDIFVVASEDTRKDLLRRNIPDEKIRVLGIPIEPPLSAFNQDVFYQENGLDKDRFTVLIVGGGFGVGPIKELAFSLDSLSPELKEKMQLIVVCSRNKRLYKRMKIYASKLKVKSAIFGFVPELYQMMMSSNVIISKSGGLTTSEALACGLPMIIISPIPGQESKNCNLLVKNNAAIRINRPAEINQVIEELIKGSDKLTTMRQGTLSLAKPNSAMDIAMLARSFMGTEQWRE